MSNFILFTWRKCKNCSTARQFLRSNPPNGPITEYELEGIQDDMRLMALFQRVSPRRMVPALIEIRGNQIIGRAIGCDSILHYFQSR